MRKGTQLVSEPHDTEHPAFENEEEDDDLPVLSYFSHKDLNDLGGLGPPRMSSTSFSAKEYKGFYKTGESPGPTLKLPNLTSSRQSRKVSLRPLSPGTSREKRMRFPGKERVRQDRKTPKGKKSSLRRRRRREYLRGSAESPLDQLNVFQERAALETDHFSKFQLEQKLADQRKEQTILLKRYRNKSMREKAKANKAELHALEAMIATGARICRRLEIRLEGHSFTAKRRRRWKELLAIEAKGDELFEEALQCAYALRLDEAIDLLYVLVSST